MADYNFLIIWMFVLGETTATCEPGWSLYNGMCYSIQTANPRSFTSATSYKCSNLGADPVQHIDSGLNAFLAGLGSGSSYWVGMRLRPPQVHDVTGGVSATTPNIHSTYLNYEGCIYT
ncbi:unnamed protein product, partial [Owenia fusiformis]